MKRLYIFTHPILRFSSLKSNLSHPKYVVSNHEKTHQNVPESYKLRIQKNINTMNPKGLESVFFLPSLRTFIFLTFMFLFVALFGQVGDPIYRINAGGIGIVDAPLDWILDKEGTPVPYVNHGGSNNTTGWDGGWTGTNTTGAPDLIFVTDRWDGPWGDEMVWDFPVDNGTYEVNLYFCEYKTEYSVAGTRFFDVELEGELVLDDYDIITDVGFNVASKQSFIVTVIDGNIDIDFTRVAGGENPKINGIEILTASSNTAPEISPIADQVNEQGETPSIIASATDAEGDNIAYSALNLPDGLTINPTTGEITGTITAEAGVFSVLVTATDDGTPSMNATVSFDWTITLPNQPPAFDPIVDQTNDEGETVSLFATATDPEGDNITWGATGLPTGLSINPATGEISGTISATAADFNVEITATDDGDPIESSSINFVWHVVVPVNDPPVLALIGDQTNIEGATVSVNVSATDPEGDNLIFGATGLPAGLMINANTGEITGTLAVAVGTYAVTVTVTDDGTPNLSDSEAFDWIVTPPNQAPNLASILDQLNEEGAAVSVTATATDPEGDNLTFGATGLPAGVSMNPTTGEMSGTLTATAGTYPVTVTVTDDGTGNLSANTSFNWIVTTPPVAGAILFRINAGGALIADPAMAWALDKQGTPSEYLVPGNNQTTGWAGGFAAADGVNTTIAPDELYGEFRLDATWSPDPGIKYTFPIDNGTYEVKLFFAEYQNEAVGARVFDVLLEDVLVLDDYDIVAVDGFAVAAEKTFTVEVADGTLNLLLDRIPGNGNPLLSGLQISAIGTSNTAPVLAPIADQTNYQQEEVSLATTATDADDNNLSFSASGLPSGLSINATTGEISGIIAANAVLGDYTVTVQVIDDGVPAASAVQTFTWTITIPLNLPPAIDAIANQENEQGESASITVSATDPEGDNITFGATGLPAGLSINPNTGEISGTITGAPAVYSVTVTATDDGSPTAVGSLNFSWTITLPNQAPVITAINDITSEEGETVSFTPTASDHENGTLTWGATGLPTGLSINSSTGEISGTITANAATFNVTLTATDDGDPILDDTETFDWIIIVPPPNEAPVLAAIADQENYQGETVSLTASATDPDGDNLTFSASGLPGGLTINPATGEISGTITAAPATFNVTVTVTDDGTPLIEDDMVSFEWVVTAPPPNLPPVFEPIADQEVLDGHQFHVSIPVSDPDGDDFALTSTALPEGLSLVIQPNGDPYIGGIIVPPAAGVYEITVTATDDGIPSMSSSVTFTLTILFNNPPIVEGILDQINEEGETVSLQLNATDLEGDPISFQASGLPTGLSMHATTGLISGTLTAPFGTYPVSIDVFDGTSATTINFVWFVNAPPITGDMLHRINAGGANIPTPSMAWAVDKQGTPSPFLVPGNNATTGWYGGFTVAGGVNNTIAPDSLFGEYRVDATWSDEPGIKYAFPLDNGNYEVKLFFAEYQNDVVGARVFDVLLEDILVLDDYDVVALEGFNIAVEKTFNVEVLDGILNVVLDRIPGSGYPCISGLQISAVGTNNTSPHVTPIADQTTQQTLPVNLQVLATDPDGNNLSYNAIGLPTGLSINGAGLISGNVTGATGDYNVSIQVIDDDVPIMDSVISFLWTVLPPPNVAPVLAAIADQTNYEGDAVSLALSATDEDGDNLTFTATGLPDGLTIDASTGEISGTITALENIFNVTVTVTDDGAGTLSDQQSFVWTIYEVNIAPELAAVSDQTNEEGETVSLGIIATDANGDVLTFSATGLPAGLTINPTTGLISGTITAPHDTYSVTIIVEDDGVPSIADAIAFNWIIVEPPNIPPVLVEIADRTDEQGDIVTETASATDPDGDNITYSANNLPDGLTMNPTTGEISGTITGVPAVYTVEVIATDDGTPLIEDDIITFDWTVTAPVNDPPVLAAIADQEDAQGDVVSLAVSATDIENDGLTFSATNLPGGLTINTATGEISGTITGEPNVYAVTVTVTDDGTPNESDDQTFDWTVHPPNRPPVIIAIGNQNHYEGETVSVDIDATDPEGHNITYSATGLPAGLTINFASGVISGTITAPADTYTVIVTATDDGDPVESSDYTFDWIIEIPPNIPPVLSAISDRSDEAGNQVTQTVSASDEDVDDELTFSAEGLPDGITINPTSGTMSGTILAIAGDYEVTVTVTDDGIPNMSDSQTFTWTVTPYINETPILAAIADQENAIGEPISFYASASDADGDNLFFSANNLPGSLTIDPLTGEMFGVFTGPEGNYYVQVIVWDDGTPALSDTAEFVWTVNPAVPPVSGDPVYRINAGGDAIADAPLEWLEDKQSNPTPYLDDGNNQTSGWGPGFINNGGVNNTDAPDNLFGTYRKDAPWSETDIFGYNFPVVNGFYEVNLYFAETDGMGIGSRVFDVVIEGSVELDNYDIMADVGEYVAVKKTALVEVTDGTLDLDFVSVAGDELALVRGIEIRASGNSAPLFAISNQVHEEFETVSVFVNASDPEGDNITYAATGLPNGLTMNSVTGEMSGTIVDDTTDYEVTVTVTDDGQPIQSTTKTFIWTVLPTPQPNHPPVLTMNDQTHEEGQTISVTILAADPDGDDLTFAATGLPAGLILNPSTGVISGTITALANTYPVSISVTDDGNPNLTTTRNIDWIIVVPPPNHPPVISPILDQSFMVGLTVSIPVSATDQDGDNITFSATGLPGGLTINPTTGEISGTITGNPGLYSVTVTATDDGDPVMFDTDIFNFTVEESEVAACVTVLEYQSDIIFASNFEEGSTKIFNLAPNGEKIVRVTFDIRGMMYPDFALDDGSALDGNMGTPGHKAPYQDNGSSPVGFTQGSHIYELPHQPFPILDPDIYVGYQGFTLNFDPNTDGGFEPGEEFHFSWDTDPTNISYVTTNNGPGGGGKTNGLDLAGSKVTIEWDNGAVLTKELWYTPGSVCGSQAFFNSTSIPRPTIDIAALPQDSMRVNGVNHTVRITGEPGYQVSLLVGEGGNYISGPGIPEGGYDPDYFEMNNVFAFEEIDDYIIGPEGFVDIPITLHRSDLGSFNIELPEELTKHWIIRAALRSDEACTSLPCTSACTSPVSNKIILIYDPEGGNYNPYITPIADQSNEQGESIHFPVEAFDPEAGVLTCTATGLPTGLSIDPTTGMIEGLITAATGNYNVTVTVTDDGIPARDTVRSFVWTVMPSTNANPILSVIGDQTNQIGEAVSVIVSATDPDGDNLTFSATGLPTGLTIDPVSGEINGTITATPGSYSVTVTVTDDAIPNKIDSETFTWTVTPNNPPVIVDVPDQVSQQSTNVSVQVSASDPDGHDISFTATGLPNGLNINPVTGEISGVVNDLQGVYPVQIIVTDNGIPNLSDTTNFNWTIAAPPNQAPAFSASNDRTDEEGATVSVFITATDPEGQSMTFSASGLPEGVTIDPETGKMSGTITATQGVYPVQITVMDNGNPPMGDTLSFMWTVTAPPNQSPVLAAIDDQLNDPGDSVNVSIIYATDPEGDNITYSTLNLPAGLVINANNGDIIGTITAAPGTYVVQAIATDDGIPNERDTVTFNWTINNLPNLAPVVAGISDQTNVVGDSVDLTVGATDPEGHFIVFNAIGLPAGLSINGLSGQITGVITAPIGTYPVTVIVADNGLPSESDSITFNWTVTNPANQAPVVSGVSAQTNEVDEIVSLQIQATDPEGDLLVFHAENLPQGLNIDSVSGLISGTITASPALYNVTVTVTDNGSPNESATINFGWLIEAIPNQGPAITTIPNQSNAEGEIISLQVHATDPEGHSITYSASGLPAGLSINASTGEISGTITDSANTYVVTVTATDNGVPNISDTTSFEWIVNAYINQNPVLSHVSDQFNEQGSVISIQMNATDPDGDNLTFTANELPAGLSMSSTGEISGTITDSIGVYIVTVSVTDDGVPTLSDSLAFTWTVSAPPSNLPPVISDIDSLFNETGDSISLQVNAVDAEGHTMFYSAVGLPAGLSINPMTGQISGIVTAAPGVYLVTVTVLDFGSPPASATETFVWTIIAPNERLGAAGNTLLLPSVFPNPIEDRLTLMIPTELEGRHQIRISDMSGKVLYEKNDIEEREVSIDIRHLPEGVYLLNVETGGVKYKPIRLMKK